MAQIEDPKKAFQFGYLAPGLNPYAVQQADIPDFDVEITEHGDLNYDVKTGGKMKFGDITLNNLRPVSAGIGSNWVWDWIQSIVNVADGSIGNPIAYKQSHDIVQYDYDNITVTDRWRCFGVFPKKINGQKLDRTKSENSMENITLSVDRVIKTQ